MKWLSTALPFILAAPLLIGAAIWQGKETERWGEMPEMKEFVARLDQLPLDVGPWKGTYGEKLSDSMRKAAGAEGDFCIIYTKQATGDQPAEQVRMFIDCGRLLDQSKHRPDRCYPAQGFTADSEETKLEPIEIPTTSKTTATTVDFRTAVYSKEGKKTRIYWSWASDGKWKAPEGEDGLRNLFPRTRPVYKLYVDQQVPSTGDRDGQGPCVDLITALIPAYNKVLFPSAEEEAAEKAPAPTPPSAKPKHAEAAEEKVSGTDFRFHAASLPLVA